MSSSRRRIPAIGAALVLGSAALVGSVATATAPAQASPAPAAVPAEGPKPRQVAERHTADLRLDYAAGRRTVSQRIERPGSTFVKVHVSGLKLGPGDYLTVADPAGKEKYTYHADPTKGPRPAGDSSYTIEGQGFWPMSITGDTAVVTLHTVATRDAASLKAAGYGMQIDGYYRGFSKAEQDRRDAMDPRSVCQTDARRDAVCYQSSHPTEYGKSRAVGKLLMSGGSCTAWRVGSTNRLLTNNHCMASQSSVSSSEVWFDYACATCGGNNPKTPTKVSGATFYRTNATLDYTVFSVNNFDSITSFGYLLLDNRAPVQGERIYISGHGDGDPNELSIFEDTQNGGTCKVDDTSLDNQNIGYYCDTSGGSSGSPVLAASSNKVIALHHWGGCLNGGVRSNLIYPAIADLIDNGGGTPPATIFENATNVNIPDAGAAVTSAVSVTGINGNAPATLQVSVDIKHTYRGDLVVDLVAPDGSAYRLKNSSSSDSADNVITTYPVNASSEVANGSWKLRVQDVYAQDTGYIDRVALQF